MAAVIRISVILPFLYSVSGICHEEVSERYQYYLVFPTSPESLTKDLTDFSPLHDADEFIFGKTEYSFSIRLVWDASEKDCSIKIVNVKPDINYIMPKLPDNFLIDEFTRIAFNNFYNDLLAHEKGHKDIAITTAREIEKRIMSMGSKTDCGALNLATQELVRRTKLEFDTTHEEHDDNSDYSRHMREKNPAFNINY